MRAIKLIGIGPGHPEQLTLQAINALAAVDVVFLTDKGSEAIDLLRARQTILERYCQGRRYRTVTIQDPARDRKDPEYGAAVRFWHDERACLYEELIQRELGLNECGAFLVWGDPSIYDSALRILGQVSAQGRVPFTLEIVPGISSIQLLAARHGISLHAIGEAFKVTTGRQLQDDDFESTHSVVVMLDGRCAFETLTRDDLTIYWGAYLGTADEILVAGWLSMVKDRIKAVRSEARQRKGWIMDTYLLRRRAAGGAEQGSDDGTRRDGVR